MSKLVKSIQSPISNNNYISEEAILKDNNFGNNIKIYRNAEVCNSKIGDYVSIGDASIIKDSYIKDKSEINRRNLIENSEIDSYTYTGINTIIIHAKIGRFCSISWNVSIGGSDHNYNTVTTSPLYMYHRMDTGNVIINNDNYYNDQCIIENDVWISSNVVILRGVRIGNGAIIGAGAVVTKDVEPYSIVVGNPAKVIKMRFDENTISKLSNIQWWNWPKEVINSNLDLIYSVSVDKDIINSLVEISNDIKQMKHYGREDYD